MSKVQKIQFRSVEDFLAYLPDREKEIVELLREIIMDCMPDCTEKLAYNVPYYYRHRRVCFIWPASVPWGKVKLNGVQLGFCQGYLLNDEFNYLEKGKRKQVYVKTFFRAEDIEEELVRAYLYEAVAVDEGIG